MSASMMSMMVAMLFVVALLASSVSPADGAKTYNRRGSPTANLNEKIRRIEAENPDASVAPAQWFTQQLDHFDHQDNRTWQQRYYVNDTFYDPQMGGPIFFQFGGEGPISPAYVSFLEYVNYAQVSSASYILHNTRHH